MFILMFGKIVSNSFSCQEGLHNFIYNNNYFLGKAFTKQQPRDAKDIRTSLQ